MPPLSSSTPLPAARAKTRPAFPADRRTLPRLPQTTRRGGSPGATPACFGPPLRVILLSCGARAVLSFVRHRCPLPFGRGHPGASRRRLASASLTKSVRPPRYSSGADHRPEPVIAVASSDDSQQHWRFGHGGRTDLVRDGRIGYWYTNSRCRPRGESPQRRSKGFPVFHFSDLTRV